MRIPRFAFALMMIAIFALSGGLALVKARPGGNGPWLLLTFKVPPTGQIMHLSTKTDHEAEIGGFGVSGLPGHIWTSVRFIKREGQRVELSIKTVYHDPGLPEPNGETADEALKYIPSQDCWLDPDEDLKIQVAGLGTVEVSGQFVDYVPIVPHRPNEPFDPLPEEFRLWNPVLLRENRVLVNMAPLKATDTGNDPAAMLYSPGLGRFIFSSVPVQGGIEGKLQVNQISFSLDGKDYLLIAGAPITRSDQIWVLYQPDWRPPTSEANPSRDHAMLGANSLQHLLDMK